MIPIFPEFKPIEIADRETLEDYFREHPPLVSEFTFTNLFGWRKDTLVIHVEKAKNGIIGLYQIINWEFLKNQAQGFSFVNREQDLGVEGLRKAKMSYNPVRLIKKYRITQR